MNAAMSTSVSNQIFDWGRFTAALRKELVENKRQLLLIVVSIFLFFTVFMVVGNLISTHQVRDISDILDHVLIIEKSQVLLNTSMADVTSRLAFRPLREGDQPIFVLQSPYGALGAVPAQPGEETKVDLEMLFNATLQNTEAINQLFTTSK